ncbi:MAG: hypothetical protein E7277_06980 [Lachnospiraceae bacterium]|jgi:septum formation topological specificity factor MinE|nr:hypothetical protein [Lachnospiraceae bacterium]
MQKTETKKRIMKVLSSDRIGTNQDVFSAMGEDIEKVLEKYFDMDEQVVSISVVQEEGCVLLVRIPVKSQKLTVK